MSEIKGSVKAIIESTNGNETNILLPTTLASGVYFYDGQNLQQKLDDGALGSSGEGTASYSVVPNKWQNKNIHTFGDSITAGGYPSYLKSTLGAYVTNHGSSGGTYNRDFTIIQNADLTGADAITLMTGHNSGPGNITLETSGLKDVLDVNDYSSYPTNYYGGIGKIVEYVRKTYPNVKIYLLGLHYTKRGTTSKDCQRALKEIGDYYSVPFVDVYANCGISETNIDTYSSDGTHLDLLDKKGNKLLGECIAYQMMYL